VEPAAFGVGLLVGLFTLAAGRFLDPGRALARRAARPIPMPARPAPLGFAERLAAILERVAPLSDAQRRVLAPRLARAGHRSREAPVLLRAAGVVAPGVSALIGLFAAPPLIGLSAPAGLLAGAALGLALPHLWLLNVTERRRRALSRGFPDALDLFVICVEAGLSLDATMARVARELKPALPELADELGLLAIELGFLPDRSEAFANFERRVPLAAAGALVAMVQQAERFGTPLGSALRVLAADERASALLAIEERAARLPAVLTVPMILFILPPLFIVLLGPVVVQLLGT
jgi:tight adherence protein C